MAEDEPVITRDLREWLAALGCEGVRRQYQGESAVSQIAELQTGISLLDI